MGLITWIKSYFVTVPHPREEPDYNVTMQNYDLPYTVALWKLVYQPTDPSILDNIVITVTLSTAELARGDPEIAADGWRLIVVAALANLVFKVCLAGLMGGRRLLGQLVLPLAIPLAGGALLLWLWPTPW